MRRHHLSNPRRKAIIALIAGALGILLARSPAGAQEHLAEDPSPNTRPGALHAPAATHGVVPRGEREHGNAGAAHGRATHGHAQHEGEPPINWTSFNYKGKDRKWLNPPLVFAFINFGLLLYLLVRFGKKPIISYLADRHVQIKEALEDAARMRKEAQARLDEAETKLAGLDDEISAIKTSVAHDAQAEKERIIEDAKAEAEVLIATAERTLDVEVERAKRKLEVSAVQAALAAAEKILLREINERDVARLRDEYFEQLSAPTDDHVGGAQ